MTSGVTPPKVSVVIPCYNLGQYLDETVDSVFAQTCDDFEIIIVNDGSTDEETNRLLANYWRPRTTVLTRANGGPAAARNAGIQVARGRYICALDADDKLHPDFLKKTIRVLDHDPSVTFVSCWVQMFGDESGVWKQDRCDLVTLLDECTVATPAPIRRDALLAVGAYDEHPTQIGMEDWDLWIRLAEAGYTGVILEEVLFYYRRRAHSISEFWVNGEAHLNKLRPLLEKHDASYRRHLIEVLLRKEAISCDFLQQAYRLEQQIEGVLEPLAERKQAELDRLRARRSTPDARGRSDDRTVSLARDNESLNRALEAAQLRLLDFHTSLSWRMTAPLRLAYDWWRGWMRDISGSRRLQ